MLNKVSLRFACLLAFAAFGVLGASGCGDDNDASSGTSTATEKAAENKDKGALVMSFGASSVPIWNTITALMEESAKKQGYELLTSDPQFKAPRQVSDWEAWFNRGDVKAVLGYPIQGDALVPITKRFKDEGIPVMGYIGRWEGTAATLDFDGTADARVVAEQAVKWAKEKYGDKPVRAVILSDELDDLIRARHEEMQRVLREGLPNAKVDFVKGFDAKTGFDGAKRQLSAHPDTKIWLSCCDSAIVGAHRALTTGGIEPDDPSIYMSAFDMTIDSMKLMEKPGSILRFGLILPAADIAEKALGMLTRAAEGEPPADVVIKSTPVTPETVEEVRRAEAASHAKAKQ